ncbi:hypothetical protein ACFX13_011346 [Malus domestica]|uniref:Uncharacterized protein n=1 Tax=Malus domestica TaxID=3750 RepID=A0A498IB14_MALDO|nr:PHD finger protein MALE MEIOCYTE DEATH 1-like [Malus domestica]RXH79352.1 hypothetical protein DVH24_040499 [Malus domestica]
MSTTHPFSNFCSGPHRFLGAFRDNVLEFVQEFDNLGEFLHGMNVWRRQLTVEGQGVTVPLYIIEEDVKKLSKRQTCDHCRITGWSKHLLCNRSYHVIILSEEDWNKPLQNGVLDLQNHIMYGLIHSDGYGHLLGIRGHDAGSAHLSGTEIMDLWDRMCTLLRTRAICVKDNSMKAGMDLRLLFGVACGRSWFDKWGYKFYRGSYGISRFAYVDSLNHIGSLELSKMTESSFGHQLQALLSRYRDFRTLKDLLSHLVGMIHEAENMKRNSRNVDDIKELKDNSKCKADKIRIAVNQFKEILGNGAPLMPRKALREAAVDLARANKQANRPSVGATAVLDHVLSNLDNVVVDEHHIFARTITKDHNGRDVYHLQLKEVPWEGQIYNRTCNDIKRLYDSYVKMEGLPGADSNGEVKKVKECVQIIQNCKHFVKEFDIAAQGESLPLTFICQIPWPNIDWRDEHHSKKIQEERESPIGDMVVVVPGDATIGDLKENAQKGLKDSYYFIKECFELSNIML